MGEVKCMVCGVMVAARPDGVHEKWHDCVDELRRQLEEKEREIARLRTHSALWFFRFIGEHTHGLVTIHVVNGWIKADCADCAEYASVPLAALEEILQALTPPERKP